MKISKRQFISKKAESLDKDIEALRGYLLCRIQDIVGYLTQTGRESKDVLEMCKKIIKEIK